MSHNLADVDWTRFTGRSQPFVHPEANEDLRHRTVLITGAGGSIGSVLARTIVSFEPRHLLLLDHAEAGLADLQRRFSAQPGACTAQYIVGDIRDAALLRHIMREQRVDVIFHTAACKHVPLLETNPYAAASVNALGTRTLLTEAREAGVAQLVVLSTDKAVDPISVLGVTKRISELIALTGEYDAPATKVLRLCNVLGSAGSVALVFAEQLHRRQPMTLTHAEATRYFITADEAVDSLLRVLAARPPHSMWAPNLHEPQTVESLAHFLADTFASRIFDIRYTGLRPADKLAERLWSAEEAPLDNAEEPLRRLQTWLPTPDHLSSNLELMAKAIDRRNLAQLIEALWRLVPSYRPSRTVLEAGMQELGRRR